MRRFTRKGLLVMNLSDLKGLRQLLADVIADVEAEEYPRDIDVASTFAGEEERIDELIHVSEEKDGGKWRQIQTVSCSEERCPGCPHGPFIFRYRRLKSGKLKVVYVGTPVFEPRQLVKLLAKATEPIAKGRLVIREGEP